MSCLNHRVEQYTNLSMHFGDPTAISKVVTQYRIASSCRQAWPICRQACLLFDLRFLRTATKFSAVLPP